MADEFRSAGNGTKAVNDLANIFIWSAFRYYLRQATDSYIVFSPCKYFKSANLTDRMFVRGFLFNRKHFHAAVGAGVSCILWANEEGDSRPGVLLDVFDIKAPPSGGREAVIVPGSLNRQAPRTTVVRSMSTLLSSLYDTKPRSSDEPGITCEMNGREAFRPTRGTVVFNRDIIGYLVAQKASFENADLSTLLTRCAQYNGNGFYLRRDNFLTKLPLFVVGRYPAATRWWERGVVNRSADRWSSVDAYTDDVQANPQFLKQCLLFTALSRHNKCLSFIGSDGRDYRNELCFDAGTEASKALADYETTIGLTSCGAEVPGLCPGILNPATGNYDQCERCLLALWSKVQDEARKVTASSGPRRLIPHDNVAGAASGERKPRAVYDPSFTWGLYQIDIELNTSHPVASGRTGKVSNIKDFPDLNDAIKDLKGSVARYHTETISPMLWGYGLLK